MPLSIDRSVAGGSPCLAVEGLDVGYGARQVLDRVSFSVKDGELLAIIGHNAAGKSSLLKAIFGLHEPWRGKLEFWGASVGKGARGRLGAGIAYAPQGGRVFRSLSVRENIRLAAAAGGNRRCNSERTEDILREFPALLAASGRAAGTLSGGEKQLLVLASTLATAPRMILLDEPCSGLSPTAVSDILKRLVLLREKKKITVVVVEHQVRRILSVADRVVVLRRGQVSFFGPPTELADNERLREVYA